MAADEESALPSIAVRRLAAAEEIAAAFSLMAQLRPHLREGDFVAVVRSQEADGYRLFGGFDGARLVALTGVRAARTLSRGPHLFVDDLVTAAPDRGRGVGRAMLAWLRARATAEGLPVVYLDSRDTARGFYERAGFTFLTATPCWISATEAGLAT